MSREYYPCWTRLDGRDLFLIWFSNDRDGIYALDNGAIPSFSNLSALEGFAAQRDLQLYDGLSQFTTLMPFGTGSGPVTRLHWRGT